MTDYKPEDSSFLGYDSVYIAIYVPTHKSTRRYICEDRSLQKHCSENLNDYEHVLVVLFCLLKYEHALLTRCSG
jgi:hypothetical protein